MSDKTKAQLKVELKALKAQIKSQANTIAAQDNRICELEEKVESQVAEIIKAEQRSPGWEAKLTIEKQSDRIRNLEAKLSDISARLAEAS